MYKSISKNGYSLVEALVAISILLLAVVGPMTIAVKGLQSSQFAREQTTAVFLAQEGLELVHYWRGRWGLARYRDLVNLNPSSVDSWNWINWVNVRNCRTDINPNGCGMYFTAGVNFVDCGPTGSACRLYFDETNDRNKYLHTNPPGSSITPYTRRIYVDTLGNDPDKVKVTSEVTWQVNAFNAPKTVKVETYLYDIYRF